MDEELFQIAGQSIDLSTLLIPVFAGIIGLGTNWLAIQMMFQPLEWIGWKLPFKVGFGQYKFPVIGWQGVIPSRAAKMGSIAVDTGLARLGTMYEFYETFEPEVMAAHIVETSIGDIHALVDEILEREYHELWSAAPERVRALVHERVEAELPAVVAEVLDGVGRNIDRLIDLKLMVIRFMEANPLMLNRIFRDVGTKEFRFIVRSGLWLGFVLGLGPMAIWIAYPEWWTVPLGAAVVGYLTNYIALKVIFQPLEPKKIGPFTLHGLFLRRRPEVAEAYADIIAYEVVTLDNVAEVMINGPGGDRTRRLIADTLAPVVDDAVGMARPLVRAAGSEHYDAIKEGLAAGAVGQTVGTLRDKEYARERAGNMQALLASRMRELSYPEFAQMLRSAFEQDEWMLIAVGAVLGFAAGLLQVVVTL